MMNNNPNWRVFIFSHTQQERIIENETKISGTKPTFGQVIVRGIPRVYTDIVRSRDNIRYADSIVLIEGDITKIKYSNPSYGD